MVHVVPKEDAPNIGISTTRKPIDFTTPSFTRTTESKALEEDSFYDGCGDTKTCFGNTESCVGSKTCTTIVAVIVKGERYIFEMRSQSMLNEV